MKIKLKRTDQDLINKKPVSFDTGFVVINDDTNYQTACILDFDSNFANGLLCIEVQGNSLSNLKFSRSVMDGGDFIPWMENSDFNTATEDMPSIQPANIYLLDPGTIGMIRLGNLNNIDQIKIEAKVGSIRVYGNVI